MKPWRGFPRLSGRSTAGESDAENRLVSGVIKATGHRSEFGYDGLGRRVEIVEKDKDNTGNLATTTDKKYLWDSTDIVEERSPDGLTVIKRFYGHGFVDSDGTVLFYTQDRLGSIRELTDSTQTVRARYDYDPYGRMTKIQGDKDTVFGYTGHFWHGQSGLFLTLYRAYDPNLGRWISRDPINEKGGLNLYEYVHNSPIRSIDALGLESSADCEARKTKCYIDAANWKKDADKPWQDILDKFETNPDPIYPTPGSLWGLLYGAYVAARSGAGSGGLALIPAFLIPMFDYNYTNWTHPRDMLDKNNSEYLRRLDLCSKIKCCPST